MSKIIDINKILNDWAYRVDGGMPDPKKLSHQILLEKTLIECGWNVAERYELIKSLQEDKSKPDPEREKLLKKVIKFKNKDGKDDEITVGGAIKQGEEHPAHEKAKQILGDEDPEKKKNKGDITKEPGAFDRNSDVNKSSKPEEKPEEKPKQSKEEKDESNRKKSEEVRNKIYGEGGQGTLVSDGDTPKEQSDLEIRQLCLEHGYKDFENDSGRGKPAPGNAGSMFNEVLSGEGTSILDNEPDLTEEELARVLYDQFCGTKLGNEVKSSSLDAGVKAADVPDDVEGKNKGCFSKCLVTARSAKRKQQRALESVDSVREAGVEFGEVKKIHSFYGHAESLKAQVAIIKQKLKEGKKVLAPDGTEITDVMSEEELYDLILTGGGGDNPSDTATFIEDEEGNLILNFTSDKMTTADQQANSTLINEINNRKKTVEGLGLSDDDAKTATDEIDRHKEEVDVEQQKLKKIVSPVGTQMLKDVEDNEEALNDFIEDWEGNEDTSAHWNNWQKAIAKDNGWEEPYTEEQKRCAAKLLMKVTSNEINRPIDPKTDRPQRGGAPEVKVSEDCKTKRWLSADTAKIPARSAARQHKAGKKGYDVKENIENIRKNIIRMERNHLVELNKIKVSVDGVEKGLGELIEGQQISDQLHLKMMDEDENHPMMSHGLFEVNMGGNPVNKKVLQKCLAEGKEDFTSKDFIKGFKVMAPDVDEPGDRYTWNCSLATGQKPPEFDDKGEVIDSGICKDGTPRRATGRVMYIYAVTSEGKLIKVAQKNMRTKTGDLGKYDTTVTYHKEMQECIEKGV